MSFPFWGFIDLIDHFDFYLKILWLLVALFAGDKMVVFVDRRGFFHNFRHAFFKKEDGLMPPSDLGVYMLLGINDGVNHYPGTHMVLYVGRSDRGGLRNRMFSHSKDEEYADRYRARKQWPRDVLFMTDSDIEIVARSDVSLLDWRTEFEGLFHRLFVPPCSNEFSGAKRRGKAQGCVPTVVLDLEAGTLEWAR